MTYEEIANVYATQNPYLAAMHSEADNIQTYVNLPADLEDPAALTIKRLRQAHRFSRR